MKIEELRIGQVVYNKDNEKLRCFVVGNNLVIRTITNDSRMQAISKINYCPMCGRKLKQE